MSRATRSALSFISDNSYSECATCGWIPSEGSNLSERRQQLSGHNSHCAKPAKPPKRRCCAIGAGAGAGEDGSDAEDSDENDMDMGFEPGGEGIDERQEDHSYSAYHVPAQTTGTRPLSYVASDGTLLEEDEGFGGWMQNVGLHGDDRGDDVDEGDRVMRPNDFGPSSIVLDLQKQLASAQEANFTSCFRVRRHRRDAYNEEMKRTTAEDYVDLADLGENLSISGREGDQLLSTVNNILRRHDVPLQLPKEWRTITRSVISDSKKFCTVKRVVIPYDKDYFGTEDIDKNPIGGPTGIKFNLLELIGEKLQNCNPVTFHGTPLKSFNEKGERLISSFPTGVFMERAYEQRFLQMKEETHDAEGREYVLVCIAISKDKAAMNSTRNVSATPVVMSILNLLSPLASDKTTLVGITPSDNQHSKATLLKHLEDVMGCKRKGERKRVLQASERAILFEYYKVLLTPILELEDKGFISRIGNGPDAREVVAFPKIVFFYGDNQDLDELASVSAGSKGMKCRVCVETNCHKFTGARKVARAHKFMEEHTKKLNAFEKRLFKDNTNRKVSRPKSPEEKALFEMQKAHNMISGENFGYIVGEATFRNRIHAGFHMMTPPDKLHTILKGILLAVISWSVQCLYALQVINPELYGSIIANIDYIFVHFPRWQSLLPFRIFDMPVGISTYFTDKRSNTYKGTGMSTLSLPGWRMAGIAYMLLYTIGESLPPPPNSRNVVVSIVPTKVTVREGGQPMRQEWNVMRTIVNALQSVLDMVSFSKRVDGFTTENFEQLDQITTLTQAHSQILFEMRNQLIDCSKDVKPADAKIRLFAGHKHHLISHMTEFMALYGADDNIFDTQLPEHFHIIVKGLYERSSKIKADGACYEEMASRMGVRLHIARLKRKFEKETAEELRRAVDSDSDDDEEEIAAKLALREVKAAAERDLEEKGIAKYEFKTVANFSKHILYFDAENDKFRVVGNTPAQTSQYMHTFLSMNTFTELFFSDSLEPGPCRDMVIEFVDTQVKKLSSNVSIELLAGLACTGIKSFGVPAFKIYANRLVPKNRRAIKDNQEFHPNFSCLEVTFRGEEVFSVVRVLAIIKVEGDEFSDIRLLVVQLRPTADARTNFLAAKKLEYSFTPAEGRRRDGLDIHLIELSSIVRPACVVPVFPIGWNAYMHEEFKDVVNRTYKRFRFYLVPIHQICEFAVINTALGPRIGEEEEEGQSQNLIEEWTRKGDMPLHLTNGQLTQLQTTLEISRGTAESDDSEDERASVIDDDDD